LFVLGIANSPATDWRLYDTIYTERYMRTPQENPEGYRESAPTTFADRLQGNLLLVHGTGDDNVHPQQTVQLIEALIQADKQFDMRLYPNRTHSISGGVTSVNLFKMFTEWLRENLYDAPPRDVL
jgi:dipeptidyl-peptidase-4